MTIPSLTTWLYLWMLALNPPARAVLRTSPYGQAESAAECAARYYAIAHALADVALDPAEAHLYVGHGAALREASLHLAVTYYESGGWRREVDLGTGRGARGQGVDSCLDQIRVGNGRTTEGWSHGDLVADRRTCFLAGLHRLRLSYGACRHLPPEYALTAYAAGRCDSVRGQRLSAQRVRLARRLLTAAPAVAAIAEVRP